MKIVTILNNKITCKKEVGNSCELGEFDLIDDGTYGEVGKVFIDNLWVDDPVEITNNLKLSRIQDLKLSITNKKLLDMDCVSEQTELKTLLGL